MRIYPDEKPAIIQVQSGFPSEDLTKNKLKKKYKHL